MEWRNILIVFIITLIPLACKQDVPLSETGIKEWRHYHAGPTNNKFSALSQINSNNVSQLEVAWTYKMPPNEPASAVKCNPLMIDGTIYAISAAKNLITLDAETGQQKWLLDFHQLDSIGRQSSARGLHYWESGTDRRIFYVYAKFLYAINADDGSLIRDFGDKGKVPLNLGLNLTSDLKLGLTTPGVIYQDLLIIGSQVSERLPAAPGHIRAFNVITGELVWVFHTIPQTGEYGHDTWPEALDLQVGGANNWAGMSLDVERGIVYIPTGSPAFDFYGANRLGQNLFANTLLALDAKTGERRWHFQAVHHDLWDRDLPCAPNLMTIKHKGKLRDVVVQPTKQGLFFIFDRETGEPIFEINEVPVPPSSMEGEVAWPTQPMPSWPPPFTRQEFSEEFVTDITPEANAYVRQKLSKLTTQLYSPPDTLGVVLQPDFGGGAGWGGAAVDEEKRTLVISANNFPGILQLYDREAEMANKQLTGVNLYQLHCASCHGEKREGEHFYPSLLNITEKYSSTEILGIIDNGVGVMPSFSFLSDEEKKAIVSFLSGENTTPISDETGKTRTISRKSGSLKYAHRGNNIFKDEQGYPASKPPWATLTAYDIDTWEIKWQKTLGDHPELNHPEPTGTIARGGPIVTAGRLIFIATTDHQFRAFDIDTGEILWQYQLTGPVKATPITYEWRGTQYLLIAVSGDEEEDTRGSYVAFKL